MRIYKKERETSTKSVDIWINKISEQLNEKNWTQKDLAQKSGVCEATISGWIGENKKGKKNIEPKVNGFNNVAKAFGVSTDYLLGRHKCKTPKNEVIHKSIGLSDKAIEKLKKTQKNIKSGNNESVKKLAACNFLIENIYDTPLLENLYNYLFGEFYFESKNGDGLDFASFIVSKGVNGEENKSLVFNATLEQAFYVEIQHDLMRLKDALNEKKELIEKEKYMKYEKENREAIWKDLCDTMDELGEEEDTK